MKSFTYYKSKIYDKWSLTTKIMFWLSVIGIFSGIIIGGGEYVVNSHNTRAQNINSTLTNSPQCIGENCQQNITYNECDPYEILKKYDELKSQNMSTCVNNLTNYYYEKCGFGISAYYFDSCDVKNFSSNSSPSIDYIRYVLVYPFWGKSQGDYYFLDEYLLDEDHARISIFVTQNKQLKARFIENDGTEYILLADVQDWNEKEWALIIAGLVEKNKLTLLYKNFHNETKNKLVQKNVSAFELHGNTTSQFWGSDIDGKNQANAVIADVDIDYLLRASPKYNPYLVSRLS